MAVRKLERIEMPTREEFISRYMNERQPVIITNLFESQPIASLNSSSKALEAFATVPLRVQTEYATALRSKRSHSEVMSYANYWKHSSLPGNESALCTEYDIPAAIMKCFNLPEVCLNGSIRQQEEIFNLPMKYGDNDLFANVFIANRGNRAHLHYDGDHRSVLLYQVFGRKQVLLFDTDRGQDIRGSSGNPWFSSIDLERMSEEEKLAFVDEVDGYADVIYPGETIFMPMLIWHYLEYLDDAMSFNFRFGRNPRGRFLSVDHFHRDYYIQNLGTKFAPSHMSSELEEAMTIITTEYARERGNLREKVSYMRDIFRSLCRSLAPEAEVDAYAAQLSEERELDTILADIQETMRYMDPYELARMRPAGVASDVQKRAISEGVRSKGYTDGISRQIIYNRLGKRNVEELTRAEAAQFLTYLRSPGASLV